MRLSRTLRLSLNLNLDLIQRLFAVTVGPPELRIGDEDRQSGLAGDHRRLRGHGAAIGAVMVTASASGSGNRPEGLDLSLNLNLNLSVVMMLPQMDIRQASGH